MLIQKAIQSQYFAALEMLKHVIVQCPGTLWDAPGHPEPCWKIGYHALYYAHLYLQDSEKDFNLWEHHHDPKSGEPFTQQQLLEYLAFVQKQVQDRVPALNLDAASGFDWLPFSKFELQLYNIRHIQQHAGELYERLNNNIEIDWVSRTPDYLE